MKYHYFESQDVVLERPRCFTLLRCLKLFSMSLLFLPTYQDTQGFKTQKSCTSLFNTIFKNPPSSCHPLVIRGRPLLLFSRSKDHKFRKAMTQCNRYMPRYITLHYVTHLQDTKQLIRHCVYRRIVSYTIVCLLYKDNFYLHELGLHRIDSSMQVVMLLILQIKYEGWNFNSGNYLFTTDTK